MESRCPSCDEAITIEGEDCPEELHCSSCGTAFHRALTDTLMVQTDGEGETVVFLRSSANEEGRPASATTEKQFGDYELLEEIARGGMGVVYKARQISLNRIVALKMIKSGELAGDDEVQRFRTEAEAAAQLDHPNIVGIYEVGEQNGQHFFSMGFVEGVGLDEKLKDGPLPPREAAELIATIADAVQYAHDKGIIHRDLKPANVLLDSDGKPRITDFGLAKQITADSGMTATGQVLGTPSYMPPEQAAGKIEQIGPLSDVYSLGALLYALLTGRPPFQAANVMETLKQVLEREPVSPRDLNPTVDRDLETISLKCLDKVPVRRYASARNVADDLRRYLNREPITARPVGRIERGWRWCRRHPARAGMLASVGVALLAIVGVGVAIGYQGELKSTNEQLESALSSAETEKSNAVKARQAETAARKLAEKAQQAEAKAKDELDQVLYIRRVSLALAKWQENDPRRAHKLLVECPPNRRDWEWHYVYRVCHPALLTLKAHKGRFSSVAFSPDGKQLALAGSYGTIELWDIATGRVTRTLQGHSHYVTSVVFSPDGKHLASGSWDKTTKLWDLATGSLTVTLRGHMRHVTSVTFSPDGKRLASASKDKTIRLWDTSTGRVIQKLEGHTDFVTSVAFTPDGKHLASGSWDKSMKLWDAMTGRETLTFTGHAHYVDSIAFSPDGSRLASGSWDRTVKLWDVATGRETLTLKGHTGPVRSVAFSFNGEWLVSGSFDKTIRLWDSTTGRVRNTLKGHFGFIESVAISPNGKHIASSDSYVMLWDTPSGRETFTWNGDSGDVRSVAFSPNGKHLASTASKNTVKLSDAATGRVSMRLKGHTEIVNCVAFSPDRKRLASASSDKTVKLWNASTGHEMLTLKGHAHKVTCLAFGPNGKQLASASYDKTIKLWNVANGRELLTFSGHTHPVLSVTISPDGKWLASASYDKTVKLWDTATGRTIHTLKGKNWIGRTRTVTCLAFSPDSKWLATGGWDMAVRLWEVATGRETLTLMGHSPTFNDVKFSPDGERVAAAASNHVVTLWDSATGRETLTLKGHTGAVKSLAFSPAGKRLATASADGTVRIWDARPVRRIDEIRRREIPRTLRLPPAEIASRKAKRLTAGFVASWSPDGKQIVFRESRTQKLAIINIATTKKRWLVESASAVFWSPVPGGPIAFAQTVDKVSWLMLVDADGKNVRRVARGFWPAGWSSDGKSLYFVNRFGLHSIAIGVKDAQPTKLMKLYHSYPAVSPDGRLVAHHRPGQLVVTEIKSGRNIAKWPIAGWQGLLPGWSPDSKYVGFGSYDSGKSGKKGLWILDVARKKAFLAIANNGTLPRWSPDGKRIAFDTRANGLSVKVINAADLPWPKGWREAKQKVDK